jgi:hypothetical protein
MGTSEHDRVKDNLLVEGLQDWIRLGEVHTAFRFDDHASKRSVAEAQRLTLSMIRELVDEGLFDLGEIVRNTNDGFEAWNLSLDEAMAEIEQKYVTHFDDRWVGLPAHGSSSLTRGGLWRCSCITLTTRKPPAKARSSSSQAL